MQIQEFKGKIDRLKYENKVQKDDNDQISSEFTQLQNELMKKDKSIQILGQDKDNLDEQLGSLNRSIVEREKTDRDNMQGF